MLLSQPNFKIQRPNGRLTCRPDPNRIEKSVQTMPVDLKNLPAYLTNFYYSHTIAAISLAVVLLLLICFRPKAMLKTAGFVLAFAVAAHFFTLFVDMAGTGRSQKTEMIRTVE